MRRIIMGYIVCLVVGLSCILLTLLFCKAINEILIYKIPLEFAMLWAGVNGGVFSTHSHEAYKNTYLKNKVP